MAGKGKGNAKSGGKFAVARTAKTSVVKDSESSQIAQRGVRSSEDFRDLMCALMSDVVQGKIDPEIANAACNAGRGLLRMVELEYKYTERKPTTEKTRTLVVSRRIAAA